MILHGHAYIVCVLGGVVGGVDARLHNDTHHRHSTQRTLVVVVRVSNNALEPLVRRVLCVLIGTGNTIEINHPAAPGQQGRFARTHAAHALASLPYTQIIEHLIID